MNGKFKLIIRKNNGVLRLSTQIVAGVFQSHAYRFKRFAFFFTTHVFVKICTSDIDD